MKLFKRNVYLIDFPKSSINYYLFILIILKDINSNSNIEVPMEIAKQLGLLKPPGQGGCPPCPNPPCSGGPPGCEVKAKSISEVQINGHGDFSAPVGPVFSVGENPPPGIIHPVRLLN